MKTETSRDHSVDLVPVFVLCHLQRDAGESKVGEGDALPGGLVKPESTESTSTTNQNRTKTTIDDILETLKKLEADEESEGAGKNKASSRLDWRKQISCERSSCVVS